MAPPRPGCARTSPRQSPTHGATNVSFETFPRQSYIEPSCTGMLDLPPAALGGGILDRGYRVSWRLDHPGIAC